MFAARLSSFELCDANEFALLALSLPASVRAECAIYLCARLVCCNFTNGAAASPIYFKISPEITRKIYLN